MQPARRKLLKVSIYSLLPVLGGCGGLGSRYSAPFGLKLLPGCPPGGLENKLKFVGLEELFNDIAAQVAPVNCDGRNDISMIVPDFVNIADLQSGTSGKIMGELMRSALSRDSCLKIFQVEFSSLFTLGEGGLLTLSRNAARVRNEFPSVRQAIVSTYHPWAEGVLLIVRRIDTNTCQIIRSVSKEIPFYCKPQT